MWCFTLKSSYIIFKQSDQVQELENEHIRDDREEKILYFAFVKNDNLFQTVETISSCTKVKHEHISLKVGTDEYLFVTALFPLHYKNNNNNCKILADSNLVF